MYQNDLAYYYGSMLQNFKISSIENFSLGSNFEAFPVLNRLIIFFSDWEEKLFFSLPRPLLSESTFAQIAPLSGLTPPRSYEAKIALKNGPEIKLRRLF